MTASPGRRVRLQTAKPAGSDNLLDIELLRPLSWIVQIHAIVGSQIHFELAELGIDGPASVLAIEPCPEIEPGRGRVITGTFTTARCEVLELRLAGLAEVLQPTPPHRFYSDTRQDWVPAKDLRVGECLRTRSGPPAAVESMALKAGDHRVYNLEVEQDHQFYVGEAGVLVHNDYARTPKLDEEGALRGFVDEEGKGVPTKEAWDDIVDYLRQGGRGRDTHVGSFEQAQKLVQDVLGPEARQVETYQPGEGGPAWQVHPADNSVGKPHIRFYGPDSSGHIYFGQ
jgi:hypothetical protein